MKILLLFLFIGSSIFAQFGSGKVPLENYNKNNLFTNLNKDGISNDTSIEGDPFLFDAANNFDFIVMAKDKNIFNLKSLNYDLRTNNLFLGVNKDSIVEFNSLLVDHLKVNNKTYQFFDIENTVKLSEILFQSEKLIFLNGFYLKISKEKIDPMTKVITTKRKYSVEDRFYLKLDTNEFVEIKLKEKSILKIFEEKSNIVQVYAKENNLDFSKIDDLIKIFQYYSNS